MLVSNVRTRPFFDDQNSCTIIKSHYDGELFQDLHGNRMKYWDPDREFFVFLTSSSEGLDEFRTREETRTAWPLIVYYYIFN